MPARFFELCILAGALFLSPLLTASPTDNLETEITVPLEPASPLVAEARKALSTALTGITPSAKPSPQAHEKDGVYILYGDLFGSGQDFALLSLSQRESNEEFLAEGFTAFAAWENGKWELRGLWKISSVYRPAGRQSSEIDYLPATPATAPFALKNLGDDKAPEVVVAGAVGKYYQEFYLFCFSPETQTLRFLADAMAPPEKAGNYVRLNYDSGRRSIWSEVRYLKWTGTTLREVASWHDETPYNDPEEPFIEVRSFDKKGQARSYRITMADSDSDLESNYSISSEGKPYATVAFTYKDARTSLNTENLGLMENIWLFHKLTGLPASVFPISPEVKNLRPVKKFAKVRFEKAD